MPVDNIACSKLIHTAEATRFFGLTARAIRYYEERGLIEVERDSYNRRCYDDRAQTRLRWISTLRAAKMPLRDIEFVLRAEDRDGRGAEVAATKLANLRADFARKLALVEKTLTQFESRAARILAA